MTAARAGSTLRAERHLMPPRHVADYPYSEPCAYVDRCGHVADGRNADGVTACRWHGGAA